MPITGRCACAQLSYEAAGAPVWMVNCHCRDCQKATGSGYAPLMFLPRAQTIVTGSARWREVLAESGHQVARGSCAECGSPVLIAPPRMPDAIAVLAGSLDDPALHRPRAELFCESAQPWDVMAQDTRKYPRGR